MDKVLHCTQCNQDFKSGGWYGCEGNPARKHAVERRTFYSESDRYQVQVIVETRIIGAGGNLVHVPGKIVEFIGGTFMTTDPEIQEVLEREAPMTKERYMDLRMTPELKAGRDRRIIDEQTELIAQLKARNAELAAKANGPEEEEREPVMAAAGSKKKK